MIENRNNSLLPVEPVAAAAALKYAALVVAPVGDAVVNSQILPWDPPHASPQIELVSFGPCHLALPSASHYIVAPSKPGEQLAAASVVVLFAVVAIVAFGDCSRL